MSHALPPPEFRVFTKHFNGLTKMLFNTNLIPHLIQEGVIVPMEHEELSTHTSTKKAEVVLSKVSGALESGLTESFYKILKLMKYYGNLDAQQLSTTIEHELSGLPSSEGLYHQFYYVQCVIYILKANYVIIMLHWSGLNLECIIIKNRKLKN